jgi:hypothetical protein
MKHSALILTILILPILLLTVACLGLIPHSVFKVSVEPSAIPGKAIAFIYETPLPTLPEDYSTATPLPTLPDDYSGDKAPARSASLVPSAEPIQDAYGQVYFTLWGPNAIRLVRLPGACVVGQQACPELETITTPFDMKDVFNTMTAGMPWSQDGRYAALTTHPQDALLEGRTKEELEQLKNQNPADFEVNPSTLFVYDAQANTWKEIYRADRKYIYTGVWSPDGQWLSFKMSSSMWAFHPSQADDGIYIIHADGTGLRQLVNTNSRILGWIGSSVVVEHALTASLDGSYRIEMLGLDGQVKPLFETGRIAFYHLSPDGGSILATDSAIMDAPTPQKAVDLLALDGSITHPFGVFNNRTSPISGGAWSSDGAQIAFASQRRVYVAPRAGLPREVYAADDQFVDNPSIINLQFSPDQKYLLMDVYDGMVKFVSVSLEDGQAQTLTWPGKDDIQQPSAFSWQP